MDTAVADFEAALATVSLDDATAAELSGLFDAFLAACNEDAVVVDPGVTSPGSTTPVVAKPVTAAPAGAGNAAGGHEQGPERADCGRGRTGYSPRAWRCWPGCSLPALRSPPSSR